MSVRGGSTLWIAVFAALLCARAVAEPEPLGIAGSPAAERRATQAATRTASREGEALGHAPVRPVREGVKTETPTTGPSTLRTIAALGGVIAVILGIGAGVRKLAARGGGGLLASLGAGGRAPSGVLEVLGRYPVGRGATLVLLKFDRRVLLVSQCAGRGGAAMSTLCDVTEPEEVASILLKTRDAGGEAMARQFEGLLSREEDAARASVTPPVPPRVKRDAPAPATTALQTRLTNLRQPPRRAGVSA